jgi:hypothetical protein
LPDSTPSFRVEDAWGQVKGVERRLISPDTEDISLSCQNFTKIWDEPLFFFSFQIIFPFQEAKRVAVVEFEDRVVQIKLGVGLVSNYVS